MNIHREFDYLNYYKNEEGIGYSNLAKSVLGLLNINSYPKSQRSEMRILDVGFGNGFLLKTLSKKGFQVSGMEISGSIIARLKREVEAEKLNMGLIQGDILNSPFPDNYFDIVITLEVLEHVINPQKMAKELGRILKKGGVLIVSTPYRQKIKYEKCIFCHRLTPRDAHLHSFGEEDLHKLFKEAGLEAEKKKICFSKMDKFPFLKIFYIFPFSIFLDWLDLKISSKLGLFPPFIVMRFRRK